MLGRDGIDIGISDMRRSAGSMVRMQKVKHTRHSPERKSNLYLYVKASDIPTHLVLGYTGRSCTQLEDQNSFTGPLVIIFSTHIHHIMANNGLECHSDIDRELLPG